MTDSKERLLQLCASLTLDEHQGDVMESIHTVLKDFGFKPETYEMKEIQQWLHANGVTTLHDTSVGGEEE